METITFEYSRFRALTYGIFYLVFALAIVYLFYAFGLVLFTGMMSSNFVGILLMGFGILFFSFAAIYLGSFGLKSLRMGLISKPCVKLDTDGFTDDLNNKSKIFWTDISDLEFVETNIRQNGISNISYSIRISFDENSETYEKISGQRKFLKKILFRNYDSKVELHGLKDDHETIFAYFNAFHEKFGHPNN